MNSTISSRPVVSGTTGDADVKITTGCRKKPSFPDEQDLPEISRQNLSVFVDLKKMQYFNKHTLARRRG
jgi:hypothetical protein